MARFVPGEMEGEKGVRQEMEEGEGGGEARAHVMGEIRRALAFRREVGRAVGWAFGQIKLNETGFDLFAYFNLWRRMEMERGLLH